MNAPAIYDPAKAQGSPDKVIRADVSLIWDYEAAPKVLVPCNLCGNTQPGVSLIKDRYGYPVSLCTCPDCGLKFLSPRMTAESYSKFYRGAYRALVAALAQHHNEPAETEAVRHHSQRGYALQVASAIWPHAPKDVKSLLDIGGSSGVVARSLGTLFGCRPAVLDPAAQELQGDVEAFPVLVEDFEPNGRTWDVVTMCQTADHLLDIAGTLRKVRSLLSEGGLFFVDIVDCSGPFQVKVDHPFYLTPKTAERFIRDAGFRIKDIRRAADVRHVQFVCRGNG